MRAVDIFIAYSHNDLSHKNELKKFLRPLINTGQARVWDDYEIEGGQDWEAEIKKRLYGADIILRTHSGLNTNRPAPGFGASPRTMEAWPRPRFWPAMPRRPCW